MAGGGAGSCLLQETEKLSTLTILEVSRGESGNDARCRVSDERRLLVQRVLANLAPQGRFLVSGEGIPVLADELPSLDSSQLAQLLLWVVADDLEKSVERSRGLVVVVVQRRSSRLDTLGVSW